MNRYITRTLPVVWWTLLLLWICPLALQAQSAYPVHVTVQTLSPYGLYLSDYYSGSRDRLVVTLLNRDKDQRPLQVKLRVQIKNGASFQLHSRDELYYPVITLESGVPFRLTGADLAHYLASDKIQVQGYLKEGKVPTGMTEFSVQAVDYTTGRVLSGYGTGRAWLEIKQPPMLNLPGRDEQLSWSTPQQIRFQWMPRHQGLANTQYEFVLKELPNNGADPQSSYAYGYEIYRTETRFTTFNYTHLQPLLLPGKRYGWQVRAIAKDGADEIGMFENNGYSEINWFELNDNCPAPLRVEAKGGYRKMTLEWQTLPEQQAFVVEYRPKSEHSLYEWTSVRTSDHTFTAYQLTPGWQYEYRVGVLCMTDKPVYSPIGEITLSEDNEERLAQCGIKPTIDLANQTPKENLKKGDVVIVGGDFPMKLIEVSAQGSGWYSGKGALTLPWILEIDVAVKFNRLRVNTDNRQIDGEVETETDPDASQIGSLNEVDYGGSSTTPAKVIFVTTKVDFTVPEIPSGEYDPESDELIVFDTEGEPHVIDVPKNDGKSVFPIIIEDAEGNKYQIDLPADTSTSQEGAEENGTDTSGGKQKPIITKVDDLPSGFTPGKYAASEAGFSVRFAKGDGVYAFDSGKEPWYQTAQLIKSYYPQLAEDYVAPWKLIPVGSSDVVEASISGDSADKSTVRFVLKDGSPVPFKEVNGKWQLTLPSVKSGETYEVFAVSEKKKGKVLTVGKLNVVSYPSQTRTVTLVPVGGEQPDVAFIERDLNRLYRPYGISITVKVDDCLKGSTAWDSDGDGALNLNGSGFFSKETDEMKALRKLYQSTSRNYDRNSYYVFLLDRAKAGDEPDAGLAVQGDMPRGKQFGYIFLRNTANTARLIAHELGHGIFTLRHSFDVNYSGDKFKAATSNLMDYNNGEDLAVWQWNVLAHPAPLTWFDSEGDAHLVVEKALIGGQNTGIAPNGAVINSFRSLHSEYKVVIGVNKNSYFIHTFYIYDKNQKLVKSFVWDTDKEDYLNGAESIRTSKDIEVTYNVANERVETCVYKFIGSSCYYKYARVLHLSGMKKVDEPSAGQWITTYLFDASEDCKMQFIKEAILNKDREGCSSSDMEAGKEKLLKATQITEPLQLVAIVNDVCLDALRKLDYEIITKFIQVIATQDKLKEESEVAILRLMNAINSKDYSRFYSLLETDKNKLIIKFVEQIHDASAFFWDNDNYTNFIGALVSMFNHVPESYLNRIGEVGDPHLLGQVFNLHSQPFNSDLHTFSETGLIALNEFRFKGEYQPSDGTINIIQEERVSTLATPINVGFPIWARLGVVAEHLSPLTPIIITTDQELPLVASALDAVNTTSSQLYVVPAIFLKYKGDKEFNHTVEQSTLLTLDAVTIAASGGVALATKVGWVRRAWALMEVAGAVGNIGVNTQSVTDPNVKAAVDIYNSTMGLIGLGHVGKGVLNFTKGLSETTRNLLAKNQGIRNLLAEKYLAWRVAAVKAADLPESLRRPLIEQEKVWSILGFLKVDNIYDSQKALVLKWINKIKTGSTQQKGNFGEICSDVYLADKGYAPLHKRLVDINESTHQGIDGVFEKNGNYFIVEAKYKGTATLSTLSDGTKQMSDDWILRDDRLLKAVTYNSELADKIVGSSYKRLLVEVAPDGTVVCKELDAQANIIGIFTP